MIWWRSPSWRLAHPWVQASPVFVTLLALGVGWLLWPPAVAGDLLGLVGIGLMLSGLAAETQARLKARWSGHRGWYAIVGPRAWLARQLQALGYTAPIPGPIWELHVIDTERWIAETPAESAQHFRQALTIDLSQWIATAPQNVTLAVVTFNHPTLADREGIAAAGGTVLPGTFAPSIARHFTPRVMRRIQRHMFGGIVSDRPRTDPATWSVWVIPPRLQGTESSPARIPGHR